MKKKLLNHDPEIASNGDDECMVPEGFEWDSYVAQTQLQAALDHIIKATKMVETPDIDTIIADAIVDEDGEYSDGVNEMGRKLRMVIEKRNKHLLLRLAMDVERSAGNLIQLLNPTLPPLYQQIDENYTGG